MNEQMEIFTMNSEKGERVFIGIDPGKTGCIVAINAGCEIVFWADIPSYKKDIEYESMKTIFDQLNKFNIVGILIEDQRGILQIESKKSVAGKLYRFGYLTAFVDMLQVRKEIVSPAKWKRKLNLTKEKRDSYMLAKKLFPKANFLKGLRGGMKHDRCEALLLADLCRKSFLT